MNKQRFVAPLTSLLAGGLYVLAFAPFQQAWLAFITPALLLYCWRNASTKQAFYYGLLFGLGQFGVGTSWVYVSIHYFGHANVPLAALITALFTLVLALYPGLQGLCLRLFFAKKSLFIQYIIVFPITWLIFEWLRATLLTGFPWLMLGYTQTSTFLNAFAPLIGIYGMTWLVALLNGTLVLWCSKTTKTIKVAAGLLVGIIITLAWLFYQHTWTQAINTPVSVALIQGNAPQAMKWDADYIQQNIQRYVKSSAQHLDYDVIIWPEAAIPIIAPAAQPLLDQLDQMGKNHHSTIIVGIPDSNSERTRYYNTLKILGQGRGSYQKRHLVPFGEYIPLRVITNPIMQYFNIPLSNLSPGKTHQAELTAQGIPIAPFICYEIAYPTMALKTVKNTRLIIVINDDSWFGHSLASSQQIQMAQMRALETGRYLLYASNTGITAIISPQGTTVSSAPEHVFAVLTGKVYAMQGNTPLMRYGYYPLLLLLGLLLLIALLRSSKR